MAITNAQQARQLYIKGGQVFPDGRRGFGGGADMGTVGTDGKQGGTGSNKGLSGGYQGGPKGGYGGGGGGGDNKVTGDDYRRSKKEFEDKLKADNAQKAKEAADKEKRKTIKEKIAEYNKNYKKKQLNRYQKAKIDELNSKLGQLGLDFYGDTEETYGDFIGQYAPSITEFGPGGKTPKYSQQFIDDVLSGKRKPPESFMEIDISKVPGGLLTKGLATGANFIGSKMAGPTTYEELMDIYSGDKNSYTRARDFDIDSATSKEMMEEFEPNRFKLENSEPGGGDNQVMDPCKGPNPPAYCSVGNETEEDTTPTRNLGGLAPRFAGSIFDFTGLADGGRAGMMDGGMMEDTPEGGIMDLESGRQMYFLGKLVKKATRAVKKVAKSPLGKAALMYGLGSLGASAFGKYQAGAGAGGSGFFSKAGRFLLGTKGVDEDGGTMGLLGKLGLTGGFGGFKPTLKGGITLGLGVPALMDLFGKKEEEDNGLADYYKSQGINIADIRLNPYKFMSSRMAGSQFAADGGRMGYQEGGDAEPVAKETMPLLDMDGKEMDLRAEGGFVPLGRMERADDVPARLSKNEFVFTADAVRNAGEGDIDKGAEVMYNMMKNLESGGEVSEESQGLDGAKEMFQTSQRLEEVL